MLDLPIRQRFALLAWALMMATTAAPLARGVEADDARPTPAKKDSRAATRPKEASFTTSVTPNEARPGETVTYKVTAKIDAGWHIYRYTKKQPEDGPIYTEFDFFDPAGLKIEGDWSPSVEPTRKKESAYPNMSYVEFHEDEVTWSLKLKVPADAKPGKKTLRCQAGYMICSDQNCSIPGQWTLPETVLTVTSGSKLLYGPTTEGIAALVAIEPPADQAEAPKPKEKDSRPIIRPKTATFSTEIVPAHAKPGETVSLKVSARIAPGFHIYKYSKEEIEGPTMTSFDLFDPAGLIPKGDWTAPARRSRRRIKIMPTWNSSNTTKGK